MPAEFVAYFFYIRIDFYTMHVKSKPAPSAFDNTFKKYYSRLCYFSFHILKDKSSAEDIVQESFIKYWNNMDEICNDDVSIKSFLYNTVRNASLNLIRHEKVVDNYLRKQDPSPIEEAQIINTMIKSEVLGEIYKAINTLPPHCQTISKLSFINGMRNQEIADELQISVNTVKTQKQRALQLLRLRINPELFALLLAFVLSN